jgi:ABC-type phosphate transport system substrate-binding protein
VSGEYALARALHFYLVGAPVGEIQQFVDFCRKPQGQKLVERAGFVPIKPH